MVTPEPLPILVLVIVALPAVELFKKLVTPPLSLLILALPAVELFEKLTMPKPFSINCVWVELFTMPVPTNEKEFPFVSIVKAFAPELNVMVLIVTAPERDSEVIMEI